MLKYAGSKLNVYLQFAARTIHARVIYRAAIWLDLGFGVLFLLMQVYLWRALLQERTVAGTTVSDMITYVVLSKIISSIARSRAEESIEKRLDSGDICHDLIRPLSFRAQLLWENIGACFVNLIVTAVPILFISVLFLGFKAPPTIMHLIAFIILSIGGLFISFYNCYIIGLISFYFIKAQHLKWFIDTIEMFLSGQMIPLWFYPGWLRILAEWSPFKMIYYTPIAIYLGKIPLSNLGSTFAVLIGWLALLITIESLLWRKTINRLVVQGG